MCVFLYLGHHFFSGSGVSDLVVDLHQGGPGRGQPGTGSPGRLRGLGGEGGGGDQLLGVRVVQPLKFLNSHPTPHLPKNFSLS